MESTFLSTLLFFIKNKNFWKSVSIPLLIKRYLSFYSLNLKTANLKFTRISRWRFTSCLGVNCSCLFMNKVLGGASDWNKSRMVPPFLFLYDTHWKTDRGRASPPRTLCELVRQKNSAANGQMCIPSSSVPVSTPPYCCAFPSCCNTISFNTTSPN